MNYINKEAVNALPQKIGVLFDELNDKRWGQLNDIKIVKEHIYCTLNHPLDKKLELPDIYEQAQTLRAHILESLPSNPEYMFDVRAKNPDESACALKQKAVLTDALENMAITSKLEKIVDDIIETGECILFVGWQKHFRKLRTYDPVSNTFNFKEKLSYDGPTLRTVSPADFVFDVEDKDNFDSAVKILRLKTPLDAVLNDKNNNMLDKETAAELKNSLKGETGKKIEILEYWGDIELDNGTVMKNQLVTVAQRRYVIRFEDNPYLNCPYIYANIIENPFTGRGISPLKAAIALNTASNAILNNQLSAYSLIVNPPYLAPKGAFKGEQRVTPGKIIEYDSTLLPQSPVPLNFSQALCGWDFIKYFKSSIESATGIFKTMAGEIEGTSRTATELNLSAGGQSARLNMILDAINRKVILPVVEKTAQTVANFKFGSETLKTKVKGEDVTLEINDNVRFGDYIYKYSDRKAALERKNRQKELAGIISSFANVPAVGEKINWLQCFRLALEQYGVENLENYIIKED